MDKIKNNKPKEAEEKKTDIVAKLDITAKVNKHEEFTTPPKGNGFAPPKNIVLPKVKVKTKDDTEKSEMMKILLTLQAKVAQLEEASKQREKLVAPPLTPEEESVLAPYRARKMFDKIVGIDKH